MMDKFPGFLILCGLVMLLNLREKGRDELEFNSGENLRSSH